MKKNIYFTKEKNKPLEGHILPVADWEGFDKLIMFVQKYYDAKVLAEFDGPDARRWILESNGKQFELIHQDALGNYFLAPTEDSEEIVYQIANDIDQRFQDSDEE